MPTTGYAANYLSPAVPSLSAKQKIKASIVGSPLFPLARAAYRSVFKAENARHQREMANFYSQFFNPGDTVFDGGVLFGEYTELFASRGARVISIEPNPNFHARITALARRKHIHLVKSALGAESGTASFNICSTPGFSTLQSQDSDWITSSPDYVNVQWSEAVQVDVTTLDAVAAEFGKPQFVKLDIEGYEEPALRGMSFDPAYLSFEFGARRKDQGIACIQNMGARGYEFRPIIGRDMRFVTDAWLSEVDALAWLGRFRTEDAEYGDMFCRHVA